MSAKNVSREEGRKDEEKGAAEEIRTVWRPKVRALKEQNTKLLRKVERVEELKAENTRLKRKVVGLSEMEKITEANGELAEKNKELANDADDLRKEKLQWR